MKHHELKSPEFFGVALRVAGFACVLYLLWRVTLFVASGLSWVFSS